MLGIRRILTIGAVLLLSACGSGRSATPAGSITVFAASSLTESFTAIGTAFMAANPGRVVTFDFDASSALVQQIIQGAPADVFASADSTNIDRLTTANLAAGSATVFARNSLAIIVEKGNPTGITGLSDLAKPNLKVILCAAQVPCGRFAKQILDTARLNVTAASLEANAKAVVTKVTTGEADAGIVYSTDVQAAGDKAGGVAIPPDQNVVTPYPVIAVKTSKNSALDQAFMAFLTGARGQAILRRHGFQSP